MIFAFLVFARVYCWPVTINITVEDENWLKGISLECVDFMDPPNTFIDPTEVTYNIQENLSETLIVVRTENDNALCTFTSSKTRFRKFSLENNFDKIECVKGEIENVTLSFEGLFPPRVFADFGADKTELNQSTQIVQRVKGQDLRLEARTLNPCSIRESGENNYIIACQFAIANAFTSKADLNCSFHEHDSWTMNEGIPVPWLLFTCKNLPFQPQQEMIDVDTEIAVKVVEERMKFTSALQAHCPVEAKDIEQGGDISSSISKCMKINAQTVVIQEHSDIMSQNKPNASQSGERFKIAFIISGTLLFLAMIFAILYRSHSENVKQQPEESLDASDILPDIRVPEPPPFWVTDTETV